MARLPQHILVLVVSGLAASPLAAQWRGFDQVLAIDSGLTNAAFKLDFMYAPHYHVGGAAAGDVDGDGYADLVILRGSRSPRLFRNQGDGTYSDVTSQAGLTDIYNELEIPNGALLADINGDGHLDLLLGGVNQAENPEAEHTEIRVFLNDGSGHFTDSTAASNIAAPMMDTRLESNSISAADIDGDGHVDLMVTYWHQGAGSQTGHLWRNLGGGRFEDISIAAGIGPTYADDNSLFNFTANFADLDDDGWPDLVVAADFGHSRVFHNDGDGTFTDTTQRDINGVPDVISDENGMGATVGDFDNDGDFDWFVTSIWEDTDDPCTDSQGNPCYGMTGNRLYRNDGTGQFEDVTESAGVREGDWGWGTCAADFDNDGWLDLMMVNGYQPHDSRFTGDRARLFMNDGGGSFTEHSARFGFESTGQGRALVCFDSDNDGWIDVLIQNSQPEGENAVSPHYFRNLGGDNHWLTVRLRGTELNRHAIGAKVTVTTASGRQVREIRAGNNFLSSEPPVAHFGLGQHDRIERLAVRWPNGRESARGAIDADQILELDYDQIYADHFE